MEKAIVETETTPKKDVVGMLQPELWDMIFLKLSDDAQSTLAVYEACEYFRELLRPKQTSIFFQKVLPLITPHLDVNSMLNCRLVSKMWKSTVDKYLEQAVCIPYDNSREYRYQWRNKLERTIGDLQGHYDFEDWNTVTRFINANQNVGRTSNPILTKSVNFVDYGINSRIDITALWAMIVQSFFPLVGQYIHHCSFEFAYSNLFNQRFYFHVIGEALRLMPNLRSFSVLEMGSRIYCVSHGAEPTTTWLNRRGIGIIDHFDLETVHLPFMTKLRWANVDCPEMLKYLLKPTLESLIVEFDDNSEPFDCSTLTGLSLLTCNCSVANYFIMTKWKNVNPLMLNLEAETLLDVMNFTNLFKEKLVYLNVCIPNIVFATHDLYELTLPCLKKIRLKVPSNITNLDFLRTLTGLEQIEFVFKFPDFAKVRKTKPFLQIVGFLNNLYESNIWTVLPNLNQVIFIDKVKKCNLKYKRQIL